MAKKIVYPLEEVLKVKERRVENAERVLKEKLAILAQEEEKLKQRELERDKVKKHYQDKLKQLRNTLDEGTNTDKIQQMKAYIKVVQQNLQVEEKKVKDQKDQVVLAEKNVQVARSDLNHKRKEVDKIVEHREDWLKGINKEMEVIEIREHDELGNTTYLLNKMKRKEAGL